MHEEEGLYNDRDDHMHLDPATFFPVQHIKVQEFTNEKCVQRSLERSFDAIAFSGFHYASSNSHHLVTYLCHYTDDPPSTRSGIAVISSSVTSLLVYLQLGRSAMSSFLLVRHILALVVLVTLADICLLFALVIKPFSERLAWDLACETA